MTDRVFIESLAIDTVIGVFEWERQVRQSLVLDVELHTDLTRAGLTDRLVDTVDYKALSEALRQRLESCRYRLVETLACDAVEICLERPLVDKAIVTVHKQRALRHARDVAVQVERSRGSPSARPAHRAFIGVGSNIDPVAQVRQGLSRLHDMFGAIRVSPAYETDPVGAPGSGQFLNLVVEVRTDLSPKALLKKLRALETEAGRQRNAERSAPRTLDLDLLLFDDLVHEALPQLPHSQVAEAAFVLVPLADLEPDRVHPTLGRTIGDLRAELPIRPPGVRPFSGNALY